MDALTGAGTAVSEETRALLILDQVPGVGPRGIVRLVEGFGSAVQALTAPEREFTRVLGRAGVARARSDAEHARRVDEGLAAAERLGIAVCTWGRPGYPDALVALHDPPPVLFLRGRRELLGRPGVAIVGARRSTARGRHVARRLGERLAGAGVTVVSGMALGIDGAAHVGALSGGGGTTAVVGRGADAPYPRSHAKLFRRILREGLVVSEFLPGTPALPHHFPRRNRIMAALADVVVVVEAGRRSGALITVEHALDLGREVWAVPGPIDTGVCAGSNQLLAEGARPLVSTERFVAELCGLDPRDGLASGVSAGTGERAGEGPSDVVTEGGAGSPAAAAAKLSAPERRLLETLEDGPLHVDALAARAGLDVPLALSVLVELELRGRVEQMAGMLFRAA